MPDQFGKRLKHLRQKRGYTMEQLGCMIGAAKSTISGYENGNREPQLAVIFKLANSLHTTADYLIGLSDMMEQPLLRADGEPKSCVDNILHWDGTELNEQELQSVREFVESIVLDRKHRTSHKEA